MFKERLDLIDSGQLERAADVGQWKLSKSTMRELAKSKRKIEDREDEEEEDGEAPEMMDLRQISCKVRQFDEEDEEETSVCL